MSEKHPGQSKILLLRASRAARVGARAGRLTRVLRLCRCFLEFDEGAAASTHGLRAKPKGFEALEERFEALEVYLNSCS